MRRRALFVLSLGIVFAACASPPRAVAPPPTSSRAVEPLTWALSPVRSRKRNHQLSVIARTPRGPFLYVASGLEGMGQGGMITAVDAAPIAADGSLGPFASMPPLPKGLMGPAGALANGVFVVAGGQTTLGFEDATYSSVVREDGALALWATVAPLPHPRMHAAGFAIGSRVYVLGGFSRVARGQPCTLWDDVLVADVAPDGAIAAWSQAGKLPAPRSHMSAAEADGYVYLSGGIAGDPFADSPSLADVTRARVAPDGSLVEWTPMTPLPLGIATHASFVHDGWLYVAGGIDDSPAMRDAVLRARIDRFALGPWEPAGKLPRARGHVHQLPTLGDHVYSVAGAIDFELHSTDEIAIGTFRR